MVTTDSLEKIRWGERCRHPEDARDRLINSAVICYRAFGISHTAMNDIAVQARVTRPTVYRYFPTRRDLLKAVFRRDLERFWADTTAKLQHIEKLDEYLIEALLTALGCGHKNPDRLIIFEAGSLQALEDILLTDQTFKLQLIEWLRTPLSRFTDLSPTTFDADIFAISEWLNRMIVSYLCRPNPLFGESGDLRSLLHRLLPMLSRAENQTLVAR